MAQPNLAAIAQAHKTLAHEIPLFQNLPAIAAGNQFADLQAVVQQLSQQLGQHMQLQNNHMQQLDNRLQQLDNRLQQFDARFQQVDARFLRFQQVDARFQQLDTVTEQIRQDLQGVKNTVEITYVIRFVYRVYNVVWKGASCVS